MAIWSAPDQALAFKASGVDLLLAFDTVLSALPVDSVTVIGLGGVNLTPGTQEVIGVMRFARPNEALGGELGFVAMTPEGVQAHGDARYARVSHRHPWTSIDNKPSVFSPTAHNHTVAEISDFRNRIFSYLSILMWLLRLKKISMLMRYSLAIRLRHSSHGSLACLDATEFFRGSTSRRT